MELTAFTLGVKPRGTLPAISVDLTNLVFFLVVPPLWLAFGAVVVVLPAAGVLCVTD